MKTFARSEEFTSGVARRNGSMALAPGRGVRTMPPLEAVDEQLALLVETINAEARKQHEPERTGEPGQSSNRKRPHRIWSGVVTLAADSLRLLRIWREQILLFVTVTLVGVAVGVGVTLFGR